MGKTIDLYTYVADICPTYKGFKIIPSQSAMRELMKHGKTLIYVAEILENGYDAPRKRKKSVVEKWSDKGKKTFNAVVARNYDKHEKKEVWVLIHFGKFTRK